MWTDRDTDTLRNQMQPFDICVASPPPGGPKREDHAEDVRRGRPAVRPLHAADAPRRHPGALRREVEQGEAGRVARGRGPGR